MTNTEIRPFRIDIPQAKLDELHAKLDATTWPAPLPGDGWDTGVPVSWLRGLADYLRHEYDWRAAEAELNAYPQYVTEIDGQNIHFLHVRSEDAGAVPLLITHGWPGSVVEFLDLIPLLRDFHLVIPSLPGFGFSGPVSEAGWTVNRIARAWVTLMDRLGYERFGVQGGDIGGKVSPEVGRVAPTRVIGVHTNGGPGPLPPTDLSAEETATLTDVERRRVTDVQEFMREQFGYIAIQSTRPQALAYGLVDSPVGLLAWLMDKFREWTHPRAALPEEIIGRDRLLTNWMLYWLTGTAGSAAYVGYAQHAGWGTVAENSGVPTAALVFAHDVAVRRYCEVENTMVRWTDVERGGHFAALEEPGVLAGDVRGFFGSLNPQPSPPRPREVPLMRRP